ncbi:Ribonuclease VapC5 [Burkholderiales bacterium]|nr:MAG: type II toxin-antitoxin system VapC family toxin [Burkholderiales bacterium]CAG0973773.1 Ribonuclease VapC5 [Burkholderiales bacterium]
MKGLLLDTNVYAAFKRGDATILEVIRHAPELVLCPIVLGELLAGFAAGTQTVRNRKELAEFIATPRVRVIELDGNTATHYAMLFLNLRKRGRPVPSNDLWIGALAMQHGLAVFSLDQHFREMENLSVGQCLEDFLP